METLIDQPLTLTEELCGELDEVRSEADKAQRALDGEDEPSYESVDVALRALSNIQQRIDYVKARLRTIDRREVERG